MLRIKRAETDASHSDDGALFPVVALLAAAAANEYLLLPAAASGRGCPNAGLLMKFL
jgi:hypothetical protein